MAKAIVLGYDDVDPGVDDNNVVLLATVLFVGATVPGNPIIDRGALGNGIPIPLNISTITAAATALRCNATTGALEAIAGQRVAIGRIAFLQPSITVTFPGQTTTPMAVAGLRLFHAASGTGWVMPEHPINITFPGTLNVPAGRALTCRYDMPIAIKGRLQCVVMEK